MGWGYLLKSGEQAHNGTIMYLSPSARPGGPGFASSYPGSGEGLGNHWSRHQPKVFTLHAGVRATFGLIGFPGSGEL